MTKQWHPAPGDGFIIDYDNATSKLRKITYHGVDLPVDSFQVDQTWDEVTLTLTFKGGWGVVRWIDSAADSVVDADPAHRLLNAGEETPQP